jgi:isopenicillin N synthase-like dioxygenase
MSLASLPAISYRTLDSSATLQALDQACRSWGAFVLTDSPLDVKHNSPLLTETARFFHSPPNFKHTVSRTKENPCGFYDAELTANTRDRKEIYDYSPEECSDDDFPWPSGMDVFREVVQRHYALCEDVAMTLLVAVSRNLGAPAEQLAGHFRPQHTSFLRLNYYPLVHDENTGPLGVNRHTDAGALTLLIQDEQAGLEVYRDGSWHAVGGESLVVNIGDVVQVWSNDRYVAPPHRVIASQGKERFSAPFFLNPHFDCVYEPLESLVDTDNPPVYKPISWAEFRGLRAAGDYADYGEEVQIHQYRIQR